MEHGQLASQSEALKSRLAEAEEAARLRNRLLLLVKQLASYQVPPEDMEHETLATWCMVNLPSFGVDFFTVPNGGFRYKAEGAKFKRLGVKAGVPDVWVLCARKGFHGLCIELKRVKGGRTSPEQKKWLDYLNEKGYLAEVCRGYEEAREVIKHYLKLDKM